MRKFALILMLIAAAVLVACSPATEDAAPDPGSAAEEAEATRPVSTPANLEEVPTTPPVESEPVLPVSNPTVMEAMQDLAERLEVRTDDIEVVRAENVTWSDGSLGCPQPDVMYTQALVDGTFVQLRVGDDYYNYHSGGSQGPFLCIEIAPVPGQLPPGTAGGGTQ